MSKKYEQWKRQVNIVLADMNEKSISECKVPDDVLASMFVDELDPLDVAQIILNELYGVENAPDIGEFYERNQRTHVN